MLMQGLPIALSAYLQIFGWLKIEYVDQPLKRTPHKTNLRASSSRA
jgi:hypothetical protein